MAVVVPFAAMHYNIKKLTNIDELVTPPYDMISPENIDKYRENPYNFINLTMPEGDETVKYRNSMHKVFSWLLRDMMIVDKKPGFYIYRQNIKTDAGVLSRYGFTGLMKVEDYGPVIKKHENSISSLVEDRFQLLKETQIHFENLFCIYKDKERTIELKIKDICNSLEPLIKTVDDEGSEHIIYSLEDPALIKTITEFIAGQPVYIADGQHRYEAALKYQKEMKEKAETPFTGKEPFNFIITSFFNAYSPSLKTLPFNRLIDSPAINGIDLLKKMDSSFKAAVIGFTDNRIERVARKKLRSLLSESYSKGLKSYGLYVASIPNKYFFLTLKDINKVGAKDALSLSDPMILESQVLRPLLSLSPDGGKIIYENSDNRSFDLVKSGKYSMAFLLNSPDPVKVMEIADSSMALPIKSASFYPKLLSGLTAYSMKYSQVKL